VNEAVWVTNWSREKKAEEFLERNRVVAFRLAYAILGDRTKANDATQDAILRALRA